jgi:AcrR family transcriptional regulator
VTETGLRERKKAKTRDALVQSALRQFDERGFDNVTVDDIAADCDVSPRTFFRYFASKEDVLFGDSDERCEHLLATFSAQPADMSLLAALQVAVFTVAADFQDEREAILQRHRILHATPALRDRKGERQTSWTSDVIDEARRSGRSDRMSELDLRLAVAATSTALQVATELWVDDGGQGDLQALLTDVLERLRHGLDA